MSHPSKLLKLLEQRAKKRFGQHFLASPGIVQNIVTASDVGRDSKVMEIGPGLGVLTEALLATGASVTAVELDRDMASFIRERLPEVRLIETDAAKLDFDAALDGAGWSCVANLPYNAGTRMITRMLERPDVFDKLVVMVQKEVAERLVAPAGDRKRGSLSVFAEARSEAKIRIRVPPGAFHPPPKVHSAVVAMKLRTEPDVGDAPVSVFDFVVRQAFVQPSKTLRNNLASAFTREIADKALTDSGVSPTARPAVLTLKEFQFLAAAIHRIQA